MQAEITGSNRMKTKEKVMKGKKKGKDEGPGRTKEARLENGGIW